MINFLEYTAIFVTVLIGAAIIFIVGYGLFKLIKVLFRLDLYPIVHGIFEFLKKHFWQAPSGAPSPAPTAAPSPTPTTPPAPAGGAVPTPSPTPTPVPHTRLRDALHNGIEELKKEILKNHQGLKRAMWEIALTIGGALFWEGTEVGFKRLRQKGGLPHEDWKTEKMVLEPTVVKEDQGQNPDPTTDKTTAPAAAKSAKKAEKAEKKEDEKEEKRNRKAHRKTVALLSAFALISIWILVRDPHLQHLLTIIVAMFAALVVILIFWRLGELTNRKPAEIKAGDITRTPPVIVSRHIVTRSGSGRVLRTLLVVAFLVFCVIWFTTRAHVSAAVEAPTPAVVSATATPTPQVETRHGSQFGPAFRVPTRPGCWRGIAINGLSCHFESKSTSTGEDCDIRINHDNRNIIHHFRVGLSRTNYPGVVNSVEFGNASSPNLWVKAVEN